MLRACLPLPARKQVGSAALEQDTGQIEPITRRGVPLGLARARSGGYHRVASNGWIVEGLWEVLPVLRP